ncbi:MAG: conjugal transfer protein [Burkholderiaceae bacterium]|nr:MAG: conjugal transfer protein [Burkholderiaceae bacterium]
MPVHLPPDLNQTRAVCIEAASARYQVPAALIRAVIRQENGCGKRGATNKNGTTDLGCMQINSSHLPWLRGYGITATLVQNDDCLNIQLGAYLLRRSLDAGPDFWRGVGGYNSGTYSAKKEAVNKHYRMQVWDHLVNIWQGR